MKKKVPSTPGAPPIVLRFAKSNQIKKLMQKLLSPAMGRLASCLLALLTYGAICVGEGSHAGEGSQLLSHPSAALAQQQTRREHPDGLVTSAPPVAGALLDRITGGANTNNRRRRHSSRAVGHQHQPGGSASEASAPDAIEISGAELPVDSTSSGGRAAQQQRLDGIYLREWDVNGAPHFKRRSKVWEGGMRASDACVPAPYQTLVCFLLFFHTPLPCFR